MKLKRLAVLLCLPLIFNTSISCSSQNPLGDLATNKNSDEAIFNDAQKLIDNRDYTGAIIRLESSTAGFQAIPRVKDSLAGAYAARCGMEFITFVNNLTAGGGQPIFQMAMNGFVQVDTSKYADCVHARDLIKSIGNVSVRSQSENLFLAILGIAMIGNRIRANADILPTSGGDGVVDAGFNCGPTKMPIASAAAVIEAFALVLENVTAVAAVASGVGAQLSTVATACGANCATITYAGATPAESDNSIILARGLINMQGIGLGSCNNSNPANCACGFP